MRSRICMILSAVSWTSSGPTSCLSPAFAQHNGEGFERCNLYAFMVVVVIGELNQR
ncbi:hypothetical protein Hanom_Chr05g00471551 [Helianthus anomalus]